MLEALSNLFSLVLDPIYGLTGNWWTTILLFTLVIKIVLLPLSLWVQKNSIRMVQIMPQVNRLKTRYFGDNETIGEEQTKLYKENHYHPLLSLIPLAVQILILFGLVDVVRGITNSGQPGTEFLGLVPVTDGGLSWIMPPLAGLSALVLGLAQNHINPLQREQSKAEQFSTNGLSVVLSLVLGVFVAAGMAFYWICSNVLAIGVQLACNLIVNPNNYIDREEVDATRQELDSLKNLGGKTAWWKPNPLARREKRDYKRFFNIVGKHIVFYSEGSGFYKYFKGAIEYLLEKSDLIIHYVTNDPDDQIFKIAEDNPRIFPYYTSEKRAITMFMKMEADVVVLTLPDLDNYYMKRSYVKKDVEYVYMFHHTTSVNMISPEGCYDHYDTMLCTGPHQVAELRAIEEHRHTPEKKLIEAGYDLIDQEIRDYEAREGEGNARPTILIAPSWQEDNILDSCFDDLVEPLLGKGYRIIVRPHPEYLKRFRPRWDALKQRYQHVGEEELFFEKDFSTNDSILSSDILVTDWSSISSEFCFTTLKPVVFVDTPAKVNNPNWREYGCDATDLTLRNEVGVAIEPSELRERVGEVVDEMLAGKDEWRERIAEVREHFFYNLGHGGEVAGAYLLETILDKQAEREAAA